jgi:hypothetical protein
MNAMHLGVRKVVALVVVQREAQAALVLAEVVAHEVRVLRQVDGLQRQPPQPLPPVNCLCLCEGCSEWKGRKQMDVSTPNIVVLLVSPAVAHDALRSAFTANVHRQMLLDGHGIRGYLAATSATHLILSGRGSSTAGLGAVLARVKEGHGGLRAPCSPDTASDRLSAATAADRPPAALCWRDSPSKPGVWSAE